MRSWLYIALIVFVLPGCASFEYSSDKGAVVGEIKHVPCPDFKVRNCTEGYPASLSLLPVEVGAGTYETLYEGCDLEAKAMQESQQRCKDFNLEKWR